MPEEVQGDQPPKAISQADEELLKTIREDYRYCLDYWREVREEAATDMQYVSGNPWTQDDIQDRDGRPCLTPDELSQYLKQANNNLRQNKRAIQVNPKGMGATDEDARMRAALIRGIEYESNAQAAYTTAYEQATSCGMGYFRLTTKEISDNGEVHPQIKRIPNQFTVLLDPNAREADFADARICFVTDSLRKRVFGEVYPDAVKRSFTTEDSKMAPDWIDDENIVVAEYWTAENPGKKNAKVIQYITNGVEILEKNEWDGWWIPIIAVLGEEIYVQADTGRSKRMFMSLIRRARSAQKMLCYIASQEAEEFGMAPRTPFVGYEGTFKDPDTVWKFINKVPRGWAEVQIPENWQPNWGPPPLPERPQFIPNAGAYEMARESWRRAVQAAVGVVPLPTDAQRQNEKSGIALEKIQNAEAIGSYHFTDNFDRSLENCGRQLNQLITAVIDTPRQVGIRNPDDTHALLHVSTAKHGRPQGIDDSDDYLLTDRGEFDVTISTGPSYQSQREQAQDFADTMVKDLAQIPTIPPPVVSKLLSLAVKLKDVGPLGDEIADILDPPDQNNIPPQVQAQVAQLQGTLQLTQQELAKMVMERDAKVLENKHKFEIEQMKETTETQREKLRLETQVLIAEINTKAQIQSDRERLTSDEMGKLHVSAHEQAMAAQQQAHEQDLAAKQAQAAAAQQATQITADQQAAAAQPQGA